jgi:hypothetical protein
MGQRGGLAQHGLSKLGQGGNCDFLDKTPYGGISCQLTVQIRIIAASDTLHCLCNVMDEQHINILII